MLWKLELMATVRSHQRERLPTSPAGFSCLSFVLPIRFYLWAPGQTRGGSLGYRPSYLPFVAPPYRREQASAVSDWNGSTCAVCLPPAARHPRSQRIKGFSRRGEGRGFTSVAPETLVPLPELGRQSPVFASTRWDAGAAVARPQPFGTDSVWRIEIERSGGFQQHNCVSS